MATIIARDDEDMASIMRRFKRLVEKGGFQKEWRKREFHEPASKLKQRKVAAAKKRHIKKMLREKALWESKKTRK